MTCTPSTITINISLKKNGVSNHFLSTLKIIDYHLKFSSLRLIAEYISFVGKFQRIATYKGI
jgi:hypothetical protein